MAVSVVIVGDYEFGQQRKIVDGDQKLMDNTAVNFPALKDVIEFSANAIAVMSFLGVLLSYLFKTLKSMYKKDDETSSSEALFDQKLPLGILKKTFFNFSASHLILPY